MLAKFDFNQIVNIMTPLSSLNDLQLEILCDVLRDREGEEVVAMLIGLIENGKYEAIFPLYSTLSWHQKKKVSPDLFTSELLKTLTNALKEEDVGPWALGVIKLISESRPDLSAMVKEVASGTTGVLRLALLYCNQQSDKLTFWEEFERFATDGFPKTEPEPFFLFGEFDIDWAGKESILIKLLMHKDFHLALPLLESIYMNARLSEKLHINLDHIEWWLVWMNDVNSSENDRSWYFCNRLGYFLGTYTSDVTRASFIEKFNQHNCPYRKILARDVLIHLPNLTTDSFNEDAISYFISDLSRRTLDTFDKTLLSLIATESFVQERLLSLLSIKEEPFHSNLRIVLKEVGRRHRRRYISEK